MSERSLSKRKAAGYLSAAVRPDGRLSRALALAAWRDARKQPPNAGKRATDADATESRILRPREGRGEAGDDGETLADVMLAHERVKLLQRELAVEQTKGKLVDYETARRRFFRIYRLVRDRVQGLVPRAVPALAAEFKLDEGALYRALDREVRSLLTELATLPLEQLLGEDEPEDEA